MREPQTLRSPRSSPALALQVASWALLATGVAGAALAVGSVHSVTLCLVTGVLAAAAAIAWWDPEPMNVRPVATLLFATGIVLTVYTALQSVPLPAGLLARLAPHNADVWARALWPLREAGPAWAPISEDPLATHVEVLRGVAYLLAFVTALRVARRRDGVAFLSAVLVGTGVVLAATALLHPAFGAHKLFGVYEPGPGIAERHIAPLMNPNNLAGYLNVAICFALAATLTPEPRVPRALAGAVVLLLAATQLWVASRGGVVTMGLGALLVVVIVRLARTRRQSRVGLAALVGGAAAALGAVLLVLAGSEDAADELLQTDVSKLKMFAHVMRMFPAVPVFGCGRGAFESAFAAFRNDLGHLTYTHPENVVAQWILEWGLPVGLAGLAAVAYALRPTAVLARSTTAAGAWAAIVALAVQNLGDLGTEVPGLVLAGVVCAAIVVAGTPGRAPKRLVERWAHRPRWVAIGGAASAAMAIALVAGTTGEELHRERRAMHDAALKDHVPAGAMHALARAAMLRHPAEPYLPFVTALRASYARDDNAIPWIGATLERAPVYAPAHLVLARVVASRSPSQARFEYRLAMEQWSALTDTVMAEAGRVVGGYFDAMELVPPGRAGVPALELLVRSVSERLPATRVRLDEELAARVPNHAGAALRAAQDALDDLRADEGAAWCEEDARAGCVRVAVDTAMRARKIAPEKCEARVLVARARVAAGEAAAALAELESAADTVDNRVRCLEDLAAMARVAGDEARTQRALDKITNAGCGEDAECALNLSWVAEQELQRGNSRKALALYKRAYERAPEQDALLECVARLSARAGLHAEAAEDYDRLARRRPTEAQWRKAEDAERQAAMRGAMNL